MENPDILDHKFTEIKHQPIFKFQRIEFILIGLFCLLLPLKSIVSLSIMSYVALFFCFTVILFQIGRIFLEFKNQLITKWGILLKVVLLIGNSSIYFAIVFTVLDLPYGAEFRLMALTQVMLPYILFALMLKNVSSSVKATLTASAVCVSILASGILLLLTEPTNTERILFGFLVTCTSMLGFARLWKTRLTAKEQYHTLNYLGRAILILIISSTYLF